MFAEKKVLVFKQGDSETWFCSNGKYLNIYAHMGFEKVIGLEQTNHTGWFKNKENAIQSLKRYEEKKDFWWDYCAT